MPRPPLADDKVNEILRWHRDRVALQERRRALGVSNHTIANYVRRYKQGRLAYVPPARPWRDVAADILNNQEP